MLMIHWILLGLVSGATLPQMSPWLSYSGSSTYYAINTVINSSGETWDNANQICQGLSISGLVSVTLAMPKDFSSLSRMIQASTYYNHATPRTYVGMYQDPAATTNIAGWMYVDGASFNFSYFNQSWNVMFDGFDDATGTRTGVFADNDIQNYGIIWEGRLGDHRPKDSGPAPYTIRFMCEMTPTVTYTRMLNDTLKMDQNNSISIWPFPSDSSITEAKDFCKNVTSTMSNQIGDCALEGFVLPPDYSQNFSSSTFSGVSNDDYFLFQQSTTVLGCFYKSSGIWVTAGSSGPCGKMSKVVCQVNNKGCSALFPIIPETPAPTVAPTPSPTAAPTPAPTLFPTVAPTVTPTSAPTVAPTPLPTNVSQPLLEEFGYEGDETSYSFGVVLATGAVVSVTYSSIAFETFALSQLKSLSSIHLIEDLQTFALLSLMNLNIPKALQSILTGIALTLGYIPFRGAFFSSSCRIDVSDVNGGLEKLYYMMKATSVCEVYVGALVLCSSVIVLEIIIFGIVSFWKPLFIMRSVSLTDKIKMKWFAVHVVITTIATLYAPVMYASLSLLLYSRSAGIILFAVLAFLIFILGIPGLALSKLWKHKPQKNLALDVTLRYFIKDFTPNSRLFWITDFLCRFFICLFAIFIESGIVQISLTSALLLFYALAILYVKPYVDRTTTIGKVVATAARVCCALIMLAFADDNNLLSRGGAIALQFIFVLFMMISLVFPFLYKVLHLKLVPKPKLRGITDYNIS